jgi:D-alanyl-D-alanine carboxypeptidase
VSKAIVIGCLVLILIPQSTLATSATPDFDALAKSIDATVAQGRLPSAVTVVFDARQILWTRTAGYLDVEHRDRPTIHSRYRLGSMAKAVTSTVLAIAAQQRLISFDDKAPVQTIESDRPFSLRELVNMQAGLAQAVCYEGITGDIDRDCESGFDRRFAVSITNGAGRYSYSNMGPQLAADALARKVASPFEAIARELLFAPAGMNEATYDHDRPVDSRATSFDQAGKPYPTDFRILPVAGAGFEASCQDLVRFGQLHLTGRGPNGKLLLDRQMLRTLHSAPNGGFYGYGWGRIGAGTSTEVLISDGQVNGGQAMLLLNPAHEFGALVVSNTANDQVSELALKAMDVVVPGTLAAFNAAVQKEQAAHETKVKRFSPPPNFAGSGFIRVGRDRLAIDLIVSDNRLRSLIDGKSGDQTHSEVDEGFRGWEIACPDRIYACHRPGASAKLWLSRDPSGIAGQLQVTSVNGQLPFPIRIQIH